MQLQHMQQQQQSVGPAYLRIGVLNWAKLSSAGPLTKTFMRILTAAWARDQNAIAVMLYPKAVICHSFIKPWLFGLPQATLHESSRCWTDTVGFKLATNSLHSLWHTQLCYHMTTDKYWVTFGQGQGRSPCGVGILLGHPPRVGLVDYY